MFTFYVYILCNVQHITVESRFRDWFCDHYITYCYVVKITVNIVKKLVKVKF